MQTINANTVDNIPTKFLKNHSNTTGKNIFIAGGPTFVELFEINDFCFTKKI